MTTELHRAGVDLEGLLTVLGHNLYSTPDVALRELVQNAHDSCVRRQVEHGPYDARIDVEVGATLTIVDNGAGLTHDEVVSYLATIGAGYTRLLRAKQADPRLIGAFGLGFLSAYVVAERVEVVTTSARQPDQTWRFESRDGQRYTLTEHEPTPVGTRVILHLRPQHAEFASAERVRRVLSRYCGLLPIPVYAPDAINAEPPPWRITDDDPWSARRRRTAFAARFEPLFEPLCAIALAPVDGLDAHGVLWVQDGSTYGASDHRHVSVFVRGMLVASENRKLLPEWAGFCGAVVQCDALVPTASREDVQRDATFDRLAAHVSETLIAGLRAIATTEPETWRRIRARHNEALLGAAIADPLLFDWLCDELTVPTSEGDLPMAEVSTRSGGRCVASTGEESGAEEILFRALSRPVIHGVRYGALAFATRYAERRGQRIAHLGTRGGDAGLFPPAALAPEAEAALQRLLGGPGVQVVPTRFAPASLPVLWVPDRDAQLARKLDEDESDRRIAGGLLRLARAFTAPIDRSTAARLYVNLGSPVIERLLALD
ncbi:MAG: ATP-binding protein, partial [Myxococcota bacterium]